MTSVVILVDLLSSIIFLLSETQTVVLLTSWSKQHLLSLLLNLVRRRMLLSLLFLNLLLLNLWLLNLLLFNPVGLILVSAKISRF